MIYSPDSFDSGSEAALRTEQAIETSWMAVIARSLAYLCLNNTGLRDKTVAQKALFLSSLGLDTKDIAGMLESTPASVSELMRQNRAKKAKKSGKAKKQ